MTTTSTATGAFLLDDAAQAALFLDARSVHAFGPDPVPDEVVAAVHDLVRWGPTALNSSPMRLLLVRSEQARTRLAGHMAPENRGPVLAAPLSIVVAADLDFHEHMGTLMPQVPGVRERLDANPVGRERTARNNTWLQAGYLVVGLRAAGLAVGPMSGMDAPGIDADLLAGTAWRSIMVLNVGRPADAPHPHARAARLETAQTTVVV